MNEHCTVHVRWFDGYLETFETRNDCIRFGSDLLWMVLNNGQTRHIPLRNVRWFSLSAVQTQVTVPGIAGLKGEPK